MCIREKFANTWEQKLIKKQDVDSKMFLILCVQYFIGGVCSLELMTIIENSKFPVMKTVQLYDCSKTFILPFFYFFPDDKIWCN